MNPAPRYRPRLRRRLMAAFSAYALAVSLLFGGFAMLFVYAVEDEFFSSALRQELSRQQAHHATHGDWAPPLQGFMRIYRAADPLPPDLARARAAEPRRGELAGEDGRHYHLRPLGTAGDLLVAEVSAHLVVRPLRERLLGLLAASGSAVMLLALALGAWLAWRISAPLTRLAERIAQGRPEALPTDLAGPAQAHDDEIARLARHLSELHQRTRDFIAREQAFSRDASHELRTPLTVLGMACEALQREAAPAQRAPLATMQAAIWQLQQTMDLLLALAREDSSSARAAAELPLLPEVEQWVLAMAPLLDRQAIELEIEVPASLTRPWPPALTRLLLSNLLANAIHHGSGGRIRLEADARQLRLGNASAPPPAALLEADAAGRQTGLKGEASSGLGLGLSIVRRLAERHGLQLQLSHADGWTWVALQAGSSSPHSGDAFTSS